MASPASPAPHVYSLQADETEARHTTYDTAYSMDSLKEHFRSMSNTRDLGREFGAERMEDDYNSLLTSKRDTARHALEGIDWVWWQRIQADQQAAKSAAQNFIEYVHQLRHFIATEPDNPVAVQLLSLQPAGYESLQIKLEQMEKRYRPWVAIYANPPILKDILPGLADRLDCTDDERVLLEDAQYALDECDEELFPDEASDTFKRLFPDYRP